MSIAEEQWNEEHAAEVVTMAQNATTGEPEGIYLLGEGYPVADPFDRNLARAIAYRLLRLADELPAPEVVLPTRQLRRSSAVDDALRDIDR